MIETEGAAAGQRGDSCQVYASIDEYRFPVRSDPNFDQIERLRFQREWRSALQLD
jgi:hypothetical protein